MQKQTPEIFGIAGSFHQEVSILGEAKTCNNFLKTQSFCYLLSLLFLVSSPPELLDQIKLSFQFCKIDNSYYIIITYYVMIDNNGFRVLAGIELIFFLVADVVLCFRFRTRMSTK